MMRWTDLTDPVTLPLASEQLVKTVTKRIGPISASNSIPTLLMLPSSVLEKIRQHLYSDLKHENLGLLLGRALLAEQLNCRLVCIDAAVPACQVRSSREHVTMLEESWPAIWESMADYPQAQIVGWYHSHPNHGVFFSPQDRKTQQRWFVQSWHVALVMDPVQEDYGAFAGSMGIPIPVVLL
jgi:proteasome lid subunit RPN8/RPN11